MWLQSTNEHSEHLTTEQHSSKVRILQTDERIYAYYFPRMSQVSAAVSRLDFSISAEETVWRNIRFHYCGRLAHAQCFYLQSQIIYYLTYDSLRSLERQSHQLSY